MPLPYPELMLPGSPVRDASRLSLNAIVLVLNWLFLGQPSLCRGELGVYVGSMGNCRQWKAIARLRPAVERWNQHGPVGPSDMGRAAAKFEGLEDLLDAVTRGIQRLGKQAVRANGSVRLRVPQPCHALPVDADRLRKPTFDPLDFLDNQSRRI